MKCFVCLFSYIFLLFSISLIIPSFFTSSSSNVSIYTHAFSPNGELTPAEQREKRKRIKQHQQLAWEKEYTSTSQRERVWICTDSTLSSDTIAVGIEAMGNSASAVNTDASDLSYTMTSAPEGIQSDNADYQHHNCYWKGLQGLLVEQAGLIACRDCPDVHNEGLYIETWEARYHPKGYSIEAEVVWAVPNDASSTILNVLGGTIALALRGNASFADKARHVQKAGAKGLIIIDDGTCTEDFQCGGWLGSKALYGDLASKDSPTAWQDIRIPVVLITSSQGLRLLRLLDTNEVEIEGIGNQKYTP